MIAWTEGAEVSCCILFSGCAGPVIRRILSSQNNSGARPGAVRSMARIVLDRTSKVIVIGAAIGLLAGCAATDKRLGDSALYQKAHEVSVTALDFTKSTASKSYSRMQKYLTEKDLLKTFHDTGEHSEAAVLGVLHRAGMSRTAARTPQKTPGSPTRPGASPAPADHAGKSASATPSRTAP